MAQSAKAVWLSCLPRFCTSRSSTSSYALSNMQDAHRREVALQPLQIVDIRRVNDTAAAQSRRRHHYGIRKRRLFHCANCFARSATERGWHAFDEHRGEDVFTNVGPTAPPFDVDDCWYNRYVAARHDRSEGISSAPLAPFERNQHSSVERKGHAADRRAFFGASFPSHSDLMRAKAFALRGGAPYFSK